jgi:4-hydroxybenzoate polyprenyltransferase
MINIFVAYLFFWFLFIVKIENIECYKIHNHNNSRKIGIVINANPKCINNFTKINNGIDKSKLLSYSKLLRTNNIVPTFLLNILAGWLTLPSYKLFFSKNFWAFSLITQLTMMNSMVINDIFDLKIDLINNNNRPLVNKEISIKEAHCLYISTNVVITLLSALFFHQKHFYKYIYTINLILFLYTPYLKKILFIKNITCASVVASTILLTSKSIALNDQLALSFLLQNFTPSYMPYINLIDITSKFLFLSSLYIELLLDVKDIHGDKENNIVTIPNHFGVKKTFDLLMILFTGNFLYHINIFYKNHNYKLFIGFILTNVHFFKNLFRLRKNEIINGKQILNSVKETTVSLVIFILCLILPF